MYSRLGYFAVKAETTENTPVIPDVFLGIIGIDIVTQYLANASSPIYMDRNTKINPVKGKIDAPQGTVRVQIEPKGFGYFLKGVFGAVSSGRYFPIVHRLSTASFTGTPVAGATLLQATTLATATVNTVNTLSLDVRSITVGFNSTNVVTGTNPDGTTFTFTPSATLPVPNWTVGETVTGVTSSATAAIVAVSDENDYLIMGSPTGVFTAAGENLTGGTSSSKAVLGVNAGTVYGHQFKAPQTTLPTFTVEVGYDDMAFRFTGVRFPAINSLTQEDNILTAELAMFARAEYKHATIMGAVASGAGTKTILLDQTLGLVATDTVKIWRPSTQSFIDFASSGVKTHTIGTVVPNTSITVTNLQVNIVAGDLLVLGPRTPSYSTAKEMAWIGGSVARVGDTMVSTVAASPNLAQIESFELAVTNEVEGRHAALASGIAGRFPAKNHLKGFMGNGTLRRAYLDQNFLNRLRNTTKTSLQVAHTSDQIGTTGVYYQLDWRLPNCIFQPWQPPMDTDALLDEEMPFDFYRETSPAYTAKALLVTDVTTY